MYQEIYNSIKRLFTKTSIMDELEIDRYSDDFKKTIAITCMVANTSITKVTRVIKSSKEEKLNYIFIQVRDYNSLFISTIVHDNDEYCVFIVEDNLIDLDMKDKLFTILAIVKSVVNYICTVFNRSILQFINMNQNEITIFGNSLLYSFLIITIAISDEVLNGEYNDNIIESDDIRELFDLSENCKYTPTKNTIIYAIKILRECNYDIDLLLDKGLLSTANNETYKDLLYYSIEKEPNNVDTPSVL